MFVARYYIGFLPTLLKISSLTGWNAGIFLILSPFGLIPISKLFSQFFWWCWYLCSSLSRCFSPSNYIIPSTEFVFVTIYMSECVHVYVCVCQNNGWKFQVGLFDKRDSFPFSIMRIADKSRNVPSNIVYSAIDVESLRITRTNNNPDSFFIAIKSLVVCMSKQRKQELLHLVSQVINLLSFYLSRPTNNIGRYRYSDGTLMLVFCV